LRGAGAAQRGQTGGGCVGRFGRGRERQRLLGRFLSLFGFGGSRGLGALFARWAGRLLGTGRLLGGGLLVGYLRGGRGRLALRRDGPGHAGVTRPRRRREAGELRGGLGGGGGERFVVAAHQGLGSVQQGLV